MIRVQSIFDITMPPVGLFLYIQYSSFSHSIQRVNSVNMLLRNRAQLMFSSKILQAPTADFKLTTLKSLRPIAHRYRYSTGANNMIGGFSIYKT